MTIKILLVHKCLFVLNLKKFPKWIPENRTDGRAQPQTILFMPSAMAVAHKKDYLSVFRLTYTLFIKMRNPFKIIRGNSAREGKPRAKGWC